MARPGPADSGNPESCRAGDTGNAECCLRGPADSQELLHSSAGEKLMINSLSHGFT